MNVHSMRARLNFGLLLLLLCLWPISLPGQGLPPKLKAALGANLGFSAAEIQTIEAGRPAARISDTGDPEDVLILGAIRINRPAVEFVNRYRNITEFESGPGVPAGGKFSQPPVLNDLSGLQLIKDEVDDLKECEPGDCSFKIGDKGLHRLRSGVNWKSPNYVADTNKAVRAIWLEGLLAYQSRGNSALAEYHDTEKVTRVQDGLTKMVKNLPVLQNYVPEMANYLLQFPQAKPADTDDFYYWQVADFGLKPVHRLTHVIIQKKSGQNGDAYLIANKMLYASHYFRSAVELRFLIPAEGSAANPSTYFVVLQRSYVDGLTGFKGKMLRGTVVGKSRDALERYLMASKSKVESGRK